MGLPAEQTAAFLSLLETLSTYKNRNSRFIGPQFVHLPDKEKNVEFYKQIKTPRSLEMIKQALKRDAYENISQVYYDIVTVFRNVQDTANRSSVTWRDATKMEQTLEELWQEDKNLPPLQTIDSSIRPAMSADDANAGDDTADAAAQAKARARMAGPRPDPDPSVLTDAIHESFVSDAPQSAGATIPMSTVATASPANTPQKGSVPNLSSQAQGYPSTSSANNDAPQPIYIPPTQHISGEPSIELPVFLPSSLLSLQAKQKLQAQQEEIFAARLRRLAANKRKRDSDAVADSNSGWLERKGSNSEQKQFYTEVIQRLKSEKDATSGRVLSGPINALPPPDKFPQFYQVIKDAHPPSLSSVEKHIRTNLVPDPTDFDAEFGTIFANARLWLSSGLNSSDGEALPHVYEDIIRLQRLYQEFTIGTGTITKDSLLVNTLSSTSHGPGSIPSETQELENGETRVELLERPYRVASAEKMYLESINYKGDVLEAGDYVHLYNPSDPKLPIIGQIFKTFRKNDTGKRYITANWYYRPSQTSHSAQRTFYEQEVFKTSLMSDHPIEDVIERVCVMHIDDYTKGRWDYWNEDMPVYVVEHRYRIESNSFQKIRHWVLCNPEGALPEPGTMRLFLEYIPSPPRIKSPFVRIKEDLGPGQLISPFQAEEEAQDNCYTPVESWQEGRGNVTGYAKLLLQKKLGESAQQSQDSAEEKAKKVQKTKVSTSNGVSGASLTSVKSAAAPTPAEILASQELFESLPEDITSRLRGDVTTGDMLWFTAPPLERDDSQAQPLKHSFNYLYALAQKSGL